MGKLVRDHIPSLIMAKGGYCDISFVKDKRAALVDKLSEELEEFLADPCPEELADLLEVIHGLIATTDHSYAAVEDMRKQKYAERGGFELGVYLNSMMIMDSSSGSSSSVGEGGGSSGIGSSS